MVSHQNAASGYSIIAFHYAESIVLYEYQKGRKENHPEEFLKGFQGVCVTDGYQAYHSLEEKTPGLTIAGLSTFYFYVYKLKRCKALII